MQENLDEFKFWPPPTTELSALKHLKKIVYNVVNTLAHSFLIECSSFLQTTMSTIKFRVSSMFDQI